MSKEKAKAFLDYLKSNPEASEKMKGFTMDEFEAVVAESGSNKETVVPNTF